jgi:MoxR-like ATPase
MRGREYVVPADVHDLAVDVIAHRLLLTFDALADGVDPRRLVEAIVAAVPQPQITPTQDPESREARLQSGAA